MAKIMYQFIYDKVLFKFNDYFEYSSEVSLYITCNLSKNNLFLPVLKIQKPINTLSNMWMIKGGIVFQTRSKIFLLQNLKSLIKSFF